MKRASLNDVIAGNAVKDPPNPTSGVWMIPGFGNTGAVETSEGIVFIDAPGYRGIGAMLQMLRKNLSGPISNVFFTHGHLNQSLTANDLIDEALKTCIPGDCLWP